MTYSVEFHLDPLVGGSNPPRPAKFQRAGHEPVLLTDQYRAITLENGTMGRHTNRDLRKRRAMQKTAKKLRQARLKAKLPRTGSPAPQN